MTPEQMIYTTFKQWVRGRFLETGEPRKQDKNYMASLQGDKHEN
jgi:hypothetical protein